MGTDAAPHAPTESTLHDYVQVVRRRRWVVLQALVLVPLAAILFSLQQTPKYGASSEVLVRQDLVAELAGSTNQPTGADAERDLQTHAELARAPEVARRVIKALRLDVSIADFLEATSVAPKRNANLVVFGAVDESPQLTTKIANEYARQYTRYRRELETAAVARARREVETRLRELEQNGERDSALYASQVERLQQLKTTEALQSASAIVVKAASEAKRISPRPVRNGVIGLALGLLLGLGLAFLWEALDNRVRSTRDLERRLGLPLLGRVPQPPRWAQRTNRLVMLADPNSIEAEAYRVLRTNLQFLNLEHGAKTVMVTSAVEGEGKSTTVANLAVALARAGQRVALVDLDLRRPTIDRFFDLEGQPGVTDIAVGRARLAPIDVRGDTKDGPVGKLEVLTSGPLPRDTGEFVGGKALENILAELRERADVVLIDSPPLLAVGDAMTLSAKVDAIVVLTRLGVIRRPVVDELRRVLATCRAAKLGFVVTGAELEDEHHRYGYGYGGYAYGAKPRSEASTRA